MLHCSGGLRQLADGMNEIPWTLDPLPRATLQSSSTISLPRRLRDPWTVRMEEKWVYATLGNTFPATKVDRTPLAALSSPIQQSAAKDKLGITFFTSPPFTSR